VIVIDGVGIEVPGHPIADFFTPSLEQVFELSFHDPSPFRVDPSSLPPSAQAVLAGDRVALAVYAGAALYDPSLIHRLSEMQTPTLGVWGASDRFVDLEYGRAFAAAIPKAHFEIVAAAGHMPQIESPDRLLQAVWNAADADLLSSTRTRL